MPVEISISEDVGNRRVTVSAPAEEIEEVIRILDQLRDSIGSYNVASAPEESSDTVPPPIVGHVSLSEAITVLFSSDWGVRPRRIREIRGALAISGLNYKLTTISGKLLKMTVRGQLRRLRDEKGYLYMRGSNSQAP